MLKKCNLVELFSGIGSQARALENLGVDVNTLGTCEWDVHAVVAYDLIHGSADIPDDIQKLSKIELLEILKAFTFSNSGKEALEYRAFRTYSVDALRHIYASILRNHNYVDISHLDGALLPNNIDILTYSFPCQDLSNVGAFHGYNKGIDKDSGSRSSLVWQVGRILNEMDAAEKTLPRFLLMENVPTLLSRRHLANFTTWINDLSELGYISKYFQLNASSFGLPQNRPRLLMISVHVGDNQAERELVESFFDIQTETDIISDYCASEFYKPHTVGELLRTDYSKEVFWEEAVECTPNDTVSRRKIWEDNPQIVGIDGKINLAFDTIRTITTKQDRNPNSGNLYFDSGIDDRAKFRYLTPRECLLFMGFTDADYENLKNNNIEFHRNDALFARDKIIRLAGNSIPVKLLEGIFYQVLLIEELLFEFKHSRRKLSRHGLKGNYSASIRSYLFRQGIRSRINSNPYPESATVVYPKHRTAVYIQNCFDHGHVCQAHCNNALGNRAYWKKRLIQIEKRDQEKYIKTVEMGWNALVIRECDMKGKHFKEVMDWILVCIKEKSPLKEGHGEVIYYGGY